MFDKGSILCTQFGNCPKLCTLLQQVHIWQLFYVFFNPADLKQMLNILQQFCALYLYSIERKPQISFLDYSSKTCFRYPC